MSTIRWYDRQGQPLPEGQPVERLLSNPSYKIVEQTTLANGWWVSTVWLGLDHQHGNGPPLIFETMVFTHGRDNDDHDRRLGDEVYAERYSTEAEARAGHARCCDLAWHALRVMAE